MKPRKLISQYYRILPTKAVDSSHLIKKRSRKLYEFKANKPASNAHSVHPLKSIIWTGSYGRVMLYAVRMIDTYMLTINGRSRLYPRIEDICKALVSKGVLPATESITDLFHNFQMIDLDALAFVSNWECAAAGIESLAVINEIPAYDWVIDQEDIYIEQLSKTSTRSYIPCLHEDKIVIELFLEARNLNGKVMCQLQDEKFKLFESSYTPSCEAIQEILDDLEEYF